MRMMETSGKLTRRASGQLRGERARTGDFGRQKRNISRGVIEARRRPGHGAARRFQDLRYA